MNLTHILPSFRRLTIVSAVMLAIVPAHADLNSDLAFTAFQNVDINALAGGTVLQARGGLMTFQRGISSQSLLIIDAAPADVAKKLLTWNPSTHAALKVWLHKALPPQPTLADFADFANLPDNKSVNFQIDSTANLDPAKPALQVSKEEAQMIATAAQQEKNPRALYAKVWPQIILGRINDFLGGRAGNDADLVDDGTTIHPFNDVKSLLHSDIKVYGQYQRLLNQTPFKALAGSAGHQNPACEHVLRSLRRGRLSRAGHRRDLSGAERRVDPVRRYRVLHQLRRLRDDRAGRDVADPGRRQE